MKHLFATNLHQHRSYRTWIHQVCYLMESEHERRWERMNMEYPEHNSHWIWKKCLRDHKNGRKNSMIFLIISGNDTRKTLRKQGCLAMWILIARNWNKKKENLRESLVKTSNHERSFNTISYDVRRTSNRISFFDLEPSRRENSNAWMTSRVAASPT